MTERLEKIFRELPACRVFADVACDHGYIAEGMLFSDKCERAIVSDISEKSLNKARALLTRFIEQGRCESVVSDGIDELPPCDLALIAGVGGKLICDIVRRARSLPETLAFSPMKHAGEVRKTVVGLGYRIVKDFTFSAEGKFYDIMIFKRGKDELTEEEAEFGRTNLLERSRDFAESVAERIKKLRSYAEKENISSADKQKMLAEAERLNKYAEIK